MKEWYVEIEGVELIVEGNYVPGIKPVITADPYYSEPGYGADIEDIKIYARDSNIDLVDILDGCIIEKIIELAIEKEENY